MSNEENLIPMSKRTKDEQRKIAQSGGRASGKARRNKRTSEDVAKLILSLPVVNDDDNKLLDEFGIEKNDRNLLMLMYVTAVRLALSGNLKAMAFVRDTLGDNPKNKLDEKRVKLYEKRIKILNEAKDAVSTLADEWVSSIPDTPDDEEE